MGEPMVCEWRTPETICARSVSIFMRPPRPKPCWRRQSSWLMASRKSARRRAVPVRVATRHSPCDSPAVSNRSIWEEVLSYRMRQDSGKLGVEKAAENPLPFLRDLCDPD